MQLFLPGFMVVKYLGLLLILARPLRNSQPPLSEGNPMHVFWYGSLLRPTSSILTCLQYFLATSKLIHLLDKYWMSQGDSISFTYSIFIAGSSDCLSGSGVCSLISPYNRTLQASLKPMLSISMHKLITEPLLSLSP